MGSPILGILVVTVAGFREHPNIKPDVCIKYMCNIRIYILVVYIIKFWLTMDQAGLQELKDISS